METRPAPTSRALRTVFAVGGLLGGIVIICQIMIASQRYALTAVLCTYAVGLACIPTTLILLGIGIHEKVLNQRIVISGILLSAAGALIGMWWLGAVL